MVTLVTRSRDGIKRKSREIRTGDFEINRRLSPKDGYFSFRGFSDANRPFCLYSIVSEAEGILVSVRRCAYTRKRPRAPGSDWRVTDACDIAIRRASRV